MQQTEFMIETGGAKIKALDAAGNGNFIALTETVCEFLRHLPDDSPLEFVRFCLFFEKDLETYRATVESCRDGQESVK